MTDDFGLPKGPTAHSCSAPTAGRDVLVHIAYGTRVSLFVGIAATAISVTIGVVLGLVAGYRGGIIDTIVSRITDVVLSLPLLLFAIGIVGLRLVPENCLAAPWSPGSAWSSSSS